MENTNKEYILHCVIVQKVKVSASSLEAAKNSVAIEEVERTIFERGSDSYSILDLMSENLTAEKRKFHGVVGGKTKELIAVSGRPLESIKEDFPHDTIIEITREQFESCHCLNGQPDAWTRLRDEIVVG